MNLQMLKMRNTEDHKDCTICAAALYCTEGQLQMKSCAEWKLANPKLIACSWHNPVFQGGQFDLWLTSFSWSGLGTELWLFNDVPKYRVLRCWDWTRDGLKDEHPELYFHQKHEVLGWPLVTLLPRSSTRKLSYQNPTLAHCDRPNRTGKQLSAATRKLSAILSPITMYFCIALVYACDRNLSRKPKVLLLEELMLLPCISQSNKFNCSFWAVCTFAVPVILPELHCNMCLWPEHASCRP